MFVVKGKQGMVYNLKEKLQGHGQEHLMNRITSLIHQWCLRTICIMMMTIASYSMWIICLLMAGTQQLKAKLQDTFPMKALAKQIIFQALIERISYYLLYMEKVFSNFNVGGGPMFTTSRLTTSRSETLEILMTLNAMRHLGFLKYQQSRVSSSNQQQFSSTQTDQGVSNKNYFKTLKLNPKHTEL